MKDIQQLRCIALKLNVSGTVEVLDNQRLYKDSFGFIKLQVYAPKTQNTESPVCTVFCTTRDEFGTQRISSKNHKLLYVDEVPLSGSTYLLFECYMPKEFTQTATQPNGLKLTFNYYDSATTLDTNGNVMLDKNGVPKRHATNLLVSSVYETTVYPGGWNNEDIELGLNSAEMAQIGANMRNIAGLQRDVEDLQATDVDLRNDIKQKDLRAQEAEASLGNRIDHVRSELSKEVNRATGAEQVLQENIDITNRRIDDTVSALQAENNRAQDSELKIHKRIDNVKDDLNEELTRATLAETELQGQIDTLDFRFNEFQRRFKISKTYASVEALQAGYATDDVPLYGFALIDTGNVEDEDDAKLFIKGDTQYEYLTDLSGAQGIRGEQGIQGIEGLALQAVIVVNRPPTNGVSFEAQTAAFNRMPIKGNSVVANLNYKGKIYITRANVYSVTDSTTLLAISGNPVLLTGEIALACNTFIDTNTNPAVGIVIGANKNAFNRAPFAEEYCDLLYRNMVDNTLFMVYAEYTEATDTQYNFVIRNFIKLSGEDGSIILQSDITLAGNYVNVGNISKGSESATVVYPAKGKTVEQFLTEIFSKRLQPTITQMPAVSGFALSGVPYSVEAGTSYTQFTYGTAVLSAGSYTYGGATGITAQSYSVDRICEPSSMSVTDVSTGASGTDNNGGNGFVIGDRGGTNTVSSIKYKVNVTYSEGTIAKDNLGVDSDPVVRIPAGTATQTTISVTPYRNLFYGTTSSTTPPSGTGISSSFVRGLTKSNRAYSSGTITVSVPAGATGVYIACIATKTGVTKVINETALNADVTATFVKQTGVQVAGANGYTSVAYNVWHYIPAVPYENAAVLKVTLG